MMDYYEELGIARSASAAEIHQSYRRLMQLVHPDHCGDEAGRRLAELQSKRLNAILGMLTDPLERDLYDRRLALEREVRIPPAPARSRRHTDWLWPVALATAGMALILWLAGPRREAPPLSVAPVPLASVEQTAAPKRPVARSAKPAAVTPARRLPSWGANGAVAALNTRQPSVSLPEEPLGPDPPAWAGEPFAPPSPVFAEPHPPSRETLAGEWLALPEPDIRSAGLYPPEYIELRVTEASGLVRGKYRARYRVADRAISPTVSFEFEGRASENSARLPWTGPGGASGEVTLRLLATGGLQVAWVVNQMGSEIGLISGTATLVRKAD